MYIWWTGNATFCFFFFYRFVWQLIDAFIHSFNHLFIYWIYAKRSHCRIKKNDFYGKTWYFDHIKQTHNRFSTKLFTQHLLINRNKYNLWVSYNVQSKGERLNDCTIQIKCYQVTKWLNSSFLPTRLTSSFPVIHFYSSLSDPFFFLSMWHYVSVSPAACRA